MSLFHLHSSKMATCNKLKSFCRGNTWILLLLLSQERIHAIDGAPHSEEMAQEESRGLLQFLGLSYGSGCRPPPNFPSSIHLKRDVFKDPFRQLPDKWLWKALPRSPSQVVVLTNWAYVNDYTLHSVDLLSAASMSSISSSTSWATKLTRDTNCSRILLVDGTKFLTKMKMDGNNLVTVETGVKMTRLLEFLEERGFGLPIAPIPGGKVLTIGEAVSIGAYSIGVNTFKEKSTPFGTVSSLIMSFKTVAWDRGLEIYSLKKLDRPDPRSLAFLTNLGRSFLTEVTLLVQPSYHLRCQTFSEFSSENLFASPNSTFSLIEESFAYLVEQFGKVEVTYFPYVDRSWVKVWSKVPRRPMGSLLASKKYLSGADSPIINISSYIASKLVSIFPSWSPSVSRFMFDIGVFRMRLSGANDIYGVSHDTFFTFTNSTEESYNTRGYVVITSRKEIQQVVYDFYEQFSLLRDQFQQQGKYPTTRPLKIRIAGLDSPPSVRESSSVPLVPPALSVLAPPKGHPEFDVGVVFEMEFSDLSGEEFIKELEPWIYANFQGDYALLRPLWSTEWAHESGPFKGHPGEFKELIKNSYGPAWNQAVKVLDFYDPHRIFSNPFFDSMGKL